MYYSTHKVDKNIPKVSWAGILLKEVVEQLPVRTLQKPNQSTRTVSGLWLTSTSMTVNYDPIATNNTKIPLCLDRLHVTS